MAVNFRPKNGDTVSWWFPGSIPSGVTTKFTDTGDKFPNTPELFEKRYGKAPEREGVKANFPIYGETINTLNLAMAKASEDPGNPWGFQRGTPTDLETYDFAATQAPNGWASHPIRRYLKPSDPPKDPAREALKRIASRAAEEKTHLPSTGGGRFVLQFREFLSFLDQQTGV